MADKTYNQISGEKFRELRRTIAKELNWAGATEYTGGADLMEGRSQGFLETDSSYENERANRNINMSNALIKYANLHPGALPLFQGKAPYPSPETYSFVDQIGDFGAEVAAQADAINEAVNPFSASNRGKIIWIVAGGVLLYFLIPVVLKTVMTGKGSAAPAGN